MLSHYRQLCAQKGFVPDAAQELVIERLERLKKNLDQQSGQSSWKSWLTRGSLSKGLYIYGGVGRGKTMLMDLFFDCVKIHRKRRLHFHSFMQQVHQDLKAFSTDSPGEKPLMAQIAVRWKREATLLCFDEFHITDIADAMILSRVFENLWEAGIVVVVTSNFKPEQLYPGGLHRERLFAFFDKLYEHMEVVCLEGTVDYRSRTLAGEKRYHFPLNEVSFEQIRQVYERVTQGLPDSSGQLDVQGRCIDVPQAKGGVALLSFEALCEASLGRDDYLALSRHYTTIILENIPYFADHNQDAAKRFITLVDILYDQRTNLIVSAADTPDHLYPAGRNADLFKRTASRLVEMTGVGVSQ